MKKCIFSMILILTLVVSAHAEQAIDYAQIVNGVVNLIMVKPSKVQDLINNNGLTIVDISQENPKPQTGWLYDGNNFTEPTIQQVKIIPSKHFWNRFTKKEREDLCSSNNKNVKKLLYELRLLSSVDLNRQDFKDTINQLETDNIITTGRAAELLQ